jgi:transcriptional regulator with XRE-family HTH domain
MKDDNKEMRDRVRRILIELRTENELTQSEVGDLVGKSKTAVASWEQGLSLPDVVTLYKLARHYNKTMDYMYGEE